MNKNEEQTYRHFRKDMGTVPTREKRTIIVE